MSRVRTVLVGRHTVSGEDPSRRRSSASLPVLVCLVTTGLHPGRRLDASSTSTVRRRRRLDRYRRPTATSSLICCTTWSNTIQGPRPRVVTPGLGRTTRHRHRAPRRRSTAQTKSSSRNSLTPSSVIPPLPFHQRWRRRRDGGPTGGVGCVRRELSASNQSSTASWWSRGR